MKTFLTRSISGVVYAAVILGSMIAGQAVFGAVMFFVLIVGLFEFQRIVSLNGISLNSFSYYLFPILIYITGYLIMLSIVPLKASGIIVAFLFLSMLIQLFFGNGMPLQRTGSIVLSMLYLTFPVLALSLLFFTDMKFETHQGFLLFSVFAITWINDTFAYISGSLFGKHKLFATISPKKTWEGSLGGLFFSLVGAYILFLIFGEISLAHWMLLAIITVIFGSIGDLFESMLKRSANLKESGKIIPGHGGILDRFDSVLIAGPFVLIYLYFILNEYAI